MTRLSKDEIKSSLENRMKKRSVRFFHLIVLFISLLLVVVIAIYINGYMNSCKDCNVIMISIDTLRADHLGTYGYPRDTSPYLDKFAEKSLVFENAFSQAVWTLTSHASIFTSLAISI